MSKEKKSGSKKSATQTQTLKGKLDISRGGMGYVIVEGMEQDIMVRPNDFNRAFHGDTVKVVVNKDSGRGRRTEGKVVDVAERARTTFIGNIQLNKSIAFFIYHFALAVGDSPTAARKIRGGCPHTPLKWEIF